MTFTIHAPRDCGCGGAGHDECALANSYAAAYRIVREPGYFDCACCGDIAISADGLDQVCGACADAGCEATRDASGETGWWDCQREYSGEDEAWYPGTADSAYGPIG